MDRKAVALTEVQLKTSIPVQTMQSFGGVAHNVAENLARLEIPISLLSILGKDGDGERIREHFHELHIDDRMVGSSKHHKTATYTALLDEQGEMVIALADMGIYEEMTPSFFQRFGHVLCEYPYWFIDTNIPKESIQYLRELKTTSHDIVLFVDPVSVPKAKRLIDNIQGIDFIFPNRDELEVLTNRKISTYKDILHASQSLLSSGVGTVITTLGADGVYVVNKEGTEHYPAFQAEVVDVTGAGDAFVAGYMYGYRQTENMNQSILYGLAAATLTLCTVNTVSQQMSRNQLEEIIKKKGM